MNRPNNIVYNFEFLKMDDDLGSKNPEI